MPAYILLDIEVKDSDSYSRYVGKAPEIVKKYGGRYLIRGGRVTPVSGNWNPERIVVIEFENMEQLKKCFSSPEYRAIAPLREQSTLSKAIIVEGYVPSL